MHRNSIKFYNYLRIIHPNLVLSMSHLKINRHHKFLPWYSWKWRYTAELWRSDTCNSMPKNTQGSRSRSNSGRIFKKRRRNLMERIHHLVKLIWTQHKISEDWSIGIIYSTHKKGDKLECCYYRAITLLNVTYEVLSGILYNRLAEYAEEILGDYHCVFRTNRSTIDHIFTIRQIQEKVYEYHIHLHNIYIYRL